MALLDQQPAQDAYLPITADEAKAVLQSDDSLYGDDPALKIVVQDTQKAENYQTQKQWVASWVSANTLYQSPFTARYWEGSQIQKSSIPFFTVATAVNSLAPQIVNGLFYDNPPFMFQERPGTTANQARAVSALLAYQLDEINFREEIRLGTINAVLFGTAIWKWGWEVYPTKRKVYRTKNDTTTVASPVPDGPNIEIHPDLTDDDIEVEEIEDTVDRPFFDHVVNLQYVLVDPTLSVPDIRKAKYVIHRMYPTWEDLDKLRERPGFNIPSKEKLLELFLPPVEPTDKAAGETPIKNPLWDMRAESRYEKATADLFNQPLEILERWDNDKLIIVLQKKLVIFNDKNPYGKIPFLSIGWWDVPEAFYSMGLAKTVGSEQMLQQGITNIWVDNATLSLNGVYTRVQGKSVPTQSIRISPGKIVNVENQGDFQPLQRLPPVPEAGEHISLSQNRTDQYAGAGALNTSGMSAGHSNLARSAAGATMLGSSGTTAPDFIDKITNQVFIPMLYAFQEMNNEELPAKTWKSILSDELQHAFVTQKQGSIIDLMNARIKFSVLAGAKMAARQKMAQALPIMTQYLMNEQTNQQLAIAGERVDVTEVLKMFWEVSEWKNFKDVVVDMTDEEMQRAQMNSPAAQQQAQAQQQQQMLQQKQNNSLELVDAENVARAGREYLRTQWNAQAKASEFTGR